MLKPVLILVLIAFSTAVPQQTVEREEPDLLVVKFSWAKEKQKTAVIRGRGPIATPIPSENRDLGSRRSDIRNMEKKAAVSAAEPPLPSYQLLLEVKNTGTKVVRSLVWQFEPTAGPED